MLTPLFINLFLFCKRDCKALKIHFHIPPKTKCQKLFRIPVSVTMNTMDFFILGSQLLYRPVENVLYGLVMVFLLARVLDAMLMLGTTKTEVKIISSKTEEICQAILTRVDRGVTLLDGESG